MITFITCKTVVCRWLLSEYGQQWMIDYLIWPPSTLLLDVCVSPKKDKIKVGTASIYKALTVHPSRSPRFTSALSGAGIVTLSKHLSSPQVFSVGSCYSSFSFMCMFCRSLFVLFVLFLLAFVLSVLRFTDSDYSFGIFKIFLRWGLCCSSFYCFGVCCVFVLCLSPSCVLCPQCC